MPLNLSQQASPLNIEHNSQGRVVKSTSEEEDSLHSGRRAKDQKGSNFLSGSGTLPELVVDLAQSLLEIPRSTAQDSEI